jgi:hypothetical protein
VGGTVSGLTGSGLVLQDNGGNNLAVSANGLFTFTTALAGGSAYDVTVLTQPSSQTCSVTSGSGTVISNVTNVLVACMPAAATTYTPVFTCAGACASLPTAPNVSFPSSISVTWDGVLFSLYLASPDAASDTYTWSACTAPACELFPGPTFPDLSSFQINDLSNGSNTQLFGPPSSTPLGSYETGTLSFAAH